MQDEYEQRSRQQLGQRMNHKILVSGHEPCAVASQRHHDRLGVLTGT